MENVIQIKSTPGIKRDGTKLEGDNYVDGQWVRFQRGLPRKIGGYRSINKFLAEIPNTIFEYAADLLTYVHTGSPHYVQRLFIDNSYNTSIITNRTPLFSFTPDDNNLWQFDVMATNLGTLLVTQVAPNLNDITNTAGGQLFYGTMLGTEALQAITLPTGGDASGGCVVLGSYFFFFGANGYIGWSIAGDPTNLSGIGSGADNPTGQKILVGKPLRGGPGASPSGLFWSADALVRAIFIGGAPVFEFDTIITKTSLLSSSCVIEYDGIFYWCAVDRFLTFNGVVREVPNNLNLNYFFDGLNMAYRQKVFAFKVTRFGEIWWCYPRGDATECTHAVIYNVRENTWYDTELPNDGRSAGRFPSVLAKPIMTGVTSTVLPEDDRITEDVKVRVTEDGIVRVTEDSGANQYKLWVHEVGMDEVDGQRVQPIYSAFETSDISLPITQGVNKALSISIIEPDFVQTGEMQVLIKGRVNARAPEEASDPVIIPETPGDSSEEINHFQTQRRQLRFRFESNTLGGDYQMGTVLGHVEPADGRSTS